MRAYNNKISEKANNNLNRRYAIVRMQRLAIALSIIVAISIIVLLSSSIHAFANSSSQPETKYYTSVRIEAGDTIWSISDDYCDDHYSSKAEYIEEICALNNISKDDIHAGDYILVSYYSAEDK